MLLNIVSVTVAPRLTALKFWSLTAKGCMFGKNITSPANPRETQPHFFESKFPELLKLLDTVH
ncbi:KilA-N domain-containing protein [Salmonella enterica subsp. enterica serovar Heidelberg str. 77-1831]|nr:KilA-N domain-containing protein [Salmonella enterica subsp. enterica serovar Heidelberg str. 77-1831]